MKTLTLELKLKPELTGGYVAYAELCDYVEQLRAEYEQVMIKEPNHITRGHLLACRKILKKAEELLND